MTSDNNSFAFLPITPPRNTTQHNETLPSYETDSNNVTKTIGRDPLITLTVPAIMFASGVFGNLLAIFVLVRSSRDHKQTVFYRLVGALAATDLFGTCATSPVTLAVYANNLKWVGGQHLCNYEGFVFVFVSCTTIFIIGSMAIDRVFAVSFPFFYEQNLTYYRAKFYIIGLWVLAAVMGCLPFIGLGEIKNQFPGTWCFFTFTSNKLKNQIFAYGYACIGLTVICVTAIANIIVTSILLKMRRKAIRSMTNRKRNDSELQMMVLLLGIIIVFATCWCPFLIRILINQINLRQVDVRADLHALRLASLNQILDPWVYILFRREFFKRSYAFLREHVFGGCKCFLFISSGPNTPFQRNNSGHVTRADDVTAHVHESGEYVPLEEQNDYTNEANIECGVVKEMNGFSKSSIRSDSNNTQSNEKTGLVNHQNDLDLGLHLKHSACLFCLANHPKKITLLAEDCRSLNKLSFPVANSGGEHFQANVKIRDPILLNLGSGKRESIHLSLSDLRWS